MPCAICWEALIRYQNSAQDKKAKPNYAVYAQWENSTFAQI